MLQSRTAKRKQTGHTDEIADREKQILLLQEQKENLQNLLKQIEEKLQNL
ncbi:DUF5320 domain-containing protein [Streptococcus suis]|nr:DUF5320 domain-containing protein [Streptococcus suis]AER22259.1 hypothetical protein SSUST1_1916 [Streptococcus suis ST1]MDW8593424.1 DUF5320 domain-containing protein [Streptococcus suis]MDW8622758.1 DUF5320 domain-containing protein [Streptococcus suis]WNF74766.1 DUF5320 domain-containing protein [Streptococcus suis]